MGSCLSVLDQTALAPPKVKVILHASDIQRILSEKLPGARLTIPDKSYYCTDVSEIERFLKTDPTNYHKYRSEAYDCDDFAAVLLGKSKEWVMRSSLDYPLAFGMVHGDIRNSEDDNEVRPHALNFFIDNDTNVWLVEPQNDKVSKITSNSSFWFAFC